MDLIQKYGIDINLSLDDLLQMTDDTKRQIISCLNLAKSKLVALDDSKVKELTGVNGLKARDSLIKFTNIAISAFSLYYGTANSVEMANNVITIIGNTKELLVDIYEAIKTLSTTTNFPELPDTDNNSSAPNSPGFFDKLKTFIESIDVLKAAGVLAGVGLTVVLILKHLK